MKTLSLFLIATLLAGSGLYLYSQQDSQNTVQNTANNAYESPELIGQRNFFKKYQYTYVQEQQGEETVNKLKLANAEQIPTIVSYGIDLVVNVDNSQAAQNLNQNVHLTAQADVQTIYDAKHNIFDIAVSYTMVNKHDIENIDQYEVIDGEVVYNIDGEHSIQLKSSAEDSVEPNVRVDGEFEEITDGSFVQKQYQNQFYKLLIDADSGDILQIQVEKYIEEDQSINFATQQLINDIFPELRKVSYENGKLEDETIGIVDVNYKNENLDDEHLVISKSYEDQNFVKQDIPYIKQEVEYQRNSIINKETGVVTESDADYSFQVGDKIPTDSEGQKLKSSEENSGEISVLGEMQGQVKSSFWVVAPTDLDEIISKEILRYRQETTIFEVSRIFNQVEADVEYGDGSETQFELEDFDEDREVIEVDEQTVLNSKKPNYFFEPLNKEKLTQSFEEMIQNGVQTTEMTEEQLENARILAIQRSKQREAEAAKAQADNAQYTAQQQAEQVLDVFQSLYDEKIIVESKIKALVYEKMRLEQRIEKATTTQGENEEIVKEAKAKIAEIVEELVGLNEIKKKIYKQKDRVEGLINDNLKKIEDASKKFETMIKDQTQKEQERIQKMVQELKIIKKAKEVQGKVEAFEQEFQGKISDIEMKMKSQVSRVEDLINNEKAKVQQIRQKIEEFNYLGIDDLRQKVEDRVSFQLKELVGQYMPMIEEQKQQIDEARGRFYEYISVAQDMKLKLLAYPNQIRDRIYKEIDSQLIGIVQTIDVEIQTVLTRVTENELVQEAVDFVKKFDDKLQEHGIVIRKAEDLKQVKEVLQEKAEKVIVQAKKDIIDYGKQHFQEEINLVNATKEKAQKLIEHAEEIKQYVDKVKQLPTQIKNEIKELENQILDDVGDFVQKSINDLVGKDLDAFETTEAEIFRETKTLAKVKVLGKEIGVDLVYTGYTTESRVAAKLRVGKRYIATFLSKNFNNCKAKDYGKMQSKDFVLFQATFPVLGIIVVPVSAGGRIEYGYEAGVFTGERLCEFRFGPKFVAGVYAEGAVSVLGIISAGVYAQGNFLDTSLQFVAKTQKGRSSVELTGNFKSFSIDIGVTYTWFKCSLSNLKSGQPAELPDNKTPKLQGFGRRLRRAVKRVTRPIRKVVKKVVKVVNNVIVKPVVKVAKAVKDVAIKAGKIIAKGIKFVANIYKICKRIKGRSKIFSKSGPQKTKTLFYKSVGVGI